MKLPHWIFVVVGLLIGLAQTTQAHQGFGIAQSNSSAFFDASTLTQKNSAESLNINKATAEELADLPGIGLKKAEAIVAYRKLNGNFTNIEELVNVKGIGPKMFAKLAGKVSI